MSDTDNETASLAKNKQNTPKNNPNISEMMENPNENNDTNATEAAQTVTANDTTTDNKEDNKNNKLNTSEDSFSSTNASFTDQNDQNAPPPTDENDTNNDIGKAPPSPEILYKDNSDMNDINTKNNNATNNATNNENNKATNNDAKNGGNIDSAPNEVHSSPGYRPQSSMSIELETQKQMVASHGRTGSLATENDKNNPLLTTKLQPNDAMDLQPDIGNIGRMPSISMSHKDVEMMNEYRNPSRHRHRCSPTHCLNWTMHNTIIGKIVIMILTWTTVVDFAKDCYVAYHLAELSEIWPCIVTIAILFLSLRLMLYLRVTDDTVTVWKLLIFYWPGSVYADFQIDRLSDVGVCCFWEFVILIGTPFVPFYLIYLATKKSYTLFCGDKNFENPHLLAFAVVECMFEAIPQLCLQTYLYFKHVHSDDGERDIEPFVFYVAWVVTIIVLIKIPFIVWYNWRIVHKLEFKRRHNGEVISVKYHPIRDIVASASWDHTVLIHNFIDNIGVLKAKRVLDHHYNVNCIDFMPSNTNLEILLKETNQQVRKNANGSHFELWKSNVAPNVYGTMDSSNANLLTTKADSLENRDNKTKIDNDEFQKAPEYSSDANENKDNNPSNNLSNNPSAATSPKSKSKERKILEFNGDDVIAIAGQGLEIWHWRSGQIISAFPKSRERDQFRRKKRKRTKEVKEVKFSPDGKRIIWCQGKNIHIWQIVDKRELGKIRAIQGNRLGDVLSIDVSPNGKYIAAGLHGGQIKIFNSYNCDCVRILEGHTGAVNSVKFDKDGRFVVSGSSDWTVRVWYLKTGEEIRRFQKHTSDVMCVALDATNRYVASGGRDRMLYVTYLQDPLKPHRRTKRFTGQSTGTNSGRITQTHTISSVGDEEKIAEHGNKAMIASMPTGTESVSDGSAVSQFSNFQPRMLSKRSSMMVEEMRKIDEFDEYKAERDIRCCDFSPYGEFVAVGCEDHTVNLVLLPDYCNNSGNNPSLSNTPHNKSNENYANTSNIIKESESNTQLTRNAVKSNSGPTNNNNNDNNNTNNDEAAEYHVKIDIVDENAS